MKKYIHKEIIEFLEESNAIEGVYDNQSLAEAKDAWDYAFKNRNSLTFDKILKIHKLLAHRTRPDIAGQLRNVDVWIGGHKKVFVSYQLLKENIEIWLLGFRIDKKGIRKAEWEKVIMNNHLDFEEIHPFEDFNGRTGRLLMNIQRYNTGLPILIIHEGDEQEKYYDLFKYRYA